MIQNRTVRIQKTGDDSKQRDEISKQSFEDKNRVERIQNRVASSQNR
jgi:hypothetical protein